MYMPQNVTFQIKYFLKSVHVTNSVDPYVALLRIILLGQIKDSCPAILPNLPLRSPQTIHEGS